MLSRVAARSQRNMLNVMSRGVYTKETQPYVFINEHTKVLVQGMTGNPAVLACPGSLIQLL